MPVQTRRARSAFGDRTNTPPSKKSKIRGQTPQQNLRRSLTNTRVVPANACDGREQVDLLTTDISEDPMARGGSVEVFPCMSPKGSNLVIARGHMSDEEIDCNKKFGLFWGKTNEGDVVLKSAGTSFRDPDIATILDFHTKPKKAIDIFVLMAQELKKIHDEGLIHCDIKPANICGYTIDDVCHVTIIDFGGTSEPGEVICNYTPSFSNGGHYASFAYDFFSLGLTFSEIYKQFFSEIPLELKKLVADMKSGKSLVLDLIIEELNKIKEVVPEECVTKNYLHTSVKSSLFSHGSSSFVVKSASSASSLEVSSGSSGFSAESSP